MRGFLATLLLAAGVPLCSALSPLSVRGASLVNKDVRPIQINGLWYFTSNSTTDVYAMDSLRNEEDCRRDAALMSRLGINTIGVTDLNPEVDHDMCFSIFNSVGIYVVVMLRSMFLLSGEPDLNYEYKEENMRKSLEIIDAIKDYENLLGIEIGSFPYPRNFRQNPGIYADAQKMVRSLVRDTKQYVALHATRKIPVGISFSAAYGDYLAISHMQYATCNIANEEDNMSSVDFFSFVSIDFANKNATGYREDQFTQLRRNIGKANITVPIYLGQYGLVNENQTVTNETLQETPYLYDYNNLMLQPAGPLSGGVRWEWTNVKYSDPTANWGLVNTDPDGNVLLTERFDILQAYFDSQNTDGWTGMNFVVPEGAPRPECKGDMFVNTTITDSLGSEATYTAATDWELPTAPPHISSMISNGVNGTRGQMVDVVVTTLVHTIRDSKGEIITNVELKPSSSQSRTTTARGAGNTSPPPPSNSGSNGLSTGAKAGIGVGVSVGVLAIAGALLFFLWRRKQKKKSSVTPTDGEKNDPTINGSDPNNTYAYKRVSELPSEGTAATSELPGSVGNRTSELPAPLATNGEQPVPIARNEGQPAELPTVEAMPAMDSSFLNRPAGSPRAN
ncbi:glycoside hydrolase family 72 protein [Aaosphaeria arxii CBS 175.79]|uniref:1,3-beta-glucanosyltransferase n=1 Tax=Aaosphaeria arxii CBS 175.79 TaxID=1450172 RepID=A0A6A5X973_9PLEO|nr:glycoside hydrolase family 72 protein [Aaosphaeria arxii CBS 175.79]KAF2009460.1 glycoside hydrolase family 72 protein [Aaosphaeria arxii CBS 175.79]